jgi:hypothetical protein
MSDKRRVAEKNFGLFSNGPADGSGGFLVPMDDLNVGPGKPGPEDEWQVPTGPLATQDDVSPESGRSDGTVVLPPPPTDKK